MSGQPLGVQHTRIRYNPAIDGLRGLSLPGPILVHFALLLQFASSAPRWLRHVGPGAENIQMFFVLSGALITSLWVAEYQRTGDASLSSFYQRRFRRLGPAMLAVLPVLLVIAYAWPGQGVYMPLGSNPARAVFGVGFLVGNWVLFNVTSGIGWLGPAWTLGIEEQFYLTWPAILRLGMRRSISRRAVLLLLAAAVFIALCISELLLRKYGPERTYYATPTQLPSILIGCALGYELTTNPDGRLLRFLRAPAVAIVGLAGVVVTSIAVGHYPNFEFRGLYVVYALFACMAVGHCFARAADGSLVTRALAWKPFVFLGQISYEAYLVHMVVLFTVLRIAPSMHVYPMLILDAAIILAASAGFYYLVEQPIRRRGWRAVLLGGRQLGLGQLGAQIRAGVVGTRRPAVVATGTALGLLGVVGVSVAVVEGTRSHAPAVVGSAAQGDQTSLTEKSGGHSSPGAGLATLAPAGTLHRTRGEATSVPSVTGRDGASSGPASTGAQPIRAVPAISAVAPLVGPLVGGTSVTIAGTHLSDVTGVLFGSQPARSFRVVSPTRLVARTPSRRTPGTAAIKLQRRGADPVLCLACGRGFAYLPVPSLTAILPVTAGVSGGTQVTLRGTGFTRDVKVYFGTYRIRQVTYVTSTRVMAVAPSAEQLALDRRLPGRTRVTVTVVTAGGRSKPTHAARLTYL